MYLGQQVRNTLIRCAETVSAARNMSMKLLGKRAANSSGFFKRISEGGNLTLDTAEEVIAWLSHHWPEGQAWPEETCLARPSPEFTVSLLRAFPATRLLIPLPPLPCPPKPRRSKATSAKASSKAARSRKRQKKARQQFAESPSSQALTLDG